MHSFSFMRTATLLFLLTITVPGLADKDSRGGHGHRGGHHPGQRHSERAEHREHHTKQESHDWQQHRGWQKNGAWEAHERWEDGRARHWAAEHRTWVQRGGYGGFYVTGEHWGLYFGPRHFFRIHERPVIYLGYPRFVYQGYSFILVDPWPEDWEENWYETDDVYIQYDDGYYLCNRRHPGFSIAVTVVE